MSLWPSRDITTIDVEGTLALRFKIQLDIKTFLLEALKFLWKIEFPIVFNILQELSLNSYQFKIARINVSCWWRRKSYNSIRPNIILRSSDSWLYVGWAELYLTFLRSIKVLMGWDKTVMITAGCGQTAAWTSQHHTELRCSFINWLLCKSSTKEELNCTDRIIIPELLLNKYQRECLYCGCIF